MSALRVRCVPAWAGVTAASIARAWMAQHLGHGTGWRGGAGRPMGRPMGRPLPPGCSQCRIVTAARKPCACKVKWRLQLKIDWPIRPDAALATPRHATHLAGESPTQSNVSNGLG